MGLETATSMKIKSKIVILVFICYSSAVVAAFAQPFNESPSQHKQKSHKDSKLPIRFANVMPNKYNSPMRSWQRVPNQSCHTLNASKSGVPYEPDSEKIGLLSQSKAINQEKTNKVTKNSISSSYYLISSRKAILSILVVVTSLLICDIISPAFRQWSRDVNLFLRPISNLSVPAADNSCHMKSQWSWIWSRTQTWKRAQQVVLPMLSSACCLFQILLNLFSVGCAGFNTYLGPLRPIFIGILAYFTIVSIPIQLTSPKQSEVFFSILKYTSYWALSSLPELLYVWNNRNFSKPFISDKNKLKVTQKQNENIKTVNILLHIPTMGCAACVSKIDISLSKYLKNTLNYDQSEHKENVDAPSMKGQNVITEVNVHSWLLDPKKSSDETNQQQLILNTKLKKGGIAQISFQVKKEASINSNNYNGLRSKKDHLLDSVLGRDNIIKAVEMAGFKDSSIISCTID